MNYSINNINHVNNMSEKVELKTVSSVVNEKQQRSILRNSNLPSTIPEDDVASRSSKAPSVQSQRSSAASSYGHENMTYDGPLPDRNSNLSSRNGSVQSLQ